MSSTTPDGPRDATNVLLLLSTLVIAVCGLVYELLAGTVSSYLLGDSVYQFSIVIGLFMASMGLGSFLSRFVETRLVEAFIAIQIAVGLIGGLSTLALFFAFVNVESYTPFLFLVVTLIGALVGFEIPIILRLLRTHRALKVNVSNVLTADYLGALLAAVLFPLVLVPQLGLIRTGLFFGLLNVLVAGLAIYCFRGEMRGVRRASAAGIGAAALLSAGFVQAGDLTGFFESRLYAGEIVLAESTPYQRLVITRDGTAISLFINGGLQFNTLDEYRYHEALVHPAMSVAARREDVLVLGGGDGMAVREVLRHEGVARVTVVDLDPRVTELFSGHPMLAPLNDGAFADPRVRIVNEDAWKHLETNSARYDIVIVDLPDPYDVNLSRLYSLEFYTLAAKRLNVDGVLVTQATSPLYAREAFWSIERTLASAASPYELDGTLSTHPYHAYVPSFGEWGFVLASPRAIDWRRAAPAARARFVDAAVLSGMTHFPPDMARLATEINSIQTHVLAGYYERGWSRWYR